MKQYVTFSFCIALTTLPLQYFVTIVMTVIVVTVILVMMDMTSKFLSIMLVTPAMKLLNIVMQKWLTMNLELLALLSNALKKL